MYSLAAIALTATPGTVDLSASVVSGPSRPQELKLANESPYALLVAIGADQHWLPAWMADVFLLAGQTSFGYTPSVATPFSVLTTGTLLATVAVDGECIPGTYPATLAREISTYRQQSTGFQGALAANQSQAPNVTLPLGTQTVVILLAGVAADWTNVSITGAYAFKYINRNPSTAPDAFLRYVVDVDAALNTTISVSVTRSATAGTKGFAILPSAAANVTYQTAVLR